MSIHEGCAAAGRAADFFAAPPEADLVDLAEDFFATAIVNGVGRVLTNLGG